ncbi:MAG: ABC transporter ATP-binding protein [Rhodospirillaceae bacterium]|nr:ABC transporter ATP-binding protein [Rhodospirillaceae bacterium]
MTLELRHVTKSVDGVPHIFETDLLLEEGSFNVLLGTTLAGKTTLLQLMAGLDRPSSGEIWFRGSNVTGMAVQKRNVSMVYQQFINYPHLSVYENIASPLRVAKLGRAEIEKRVGAVSELLRLTPMLQRRPAELSGGQQQRTAIARALVKDSDLVLLDEPLANLDYKLREELRDELPRLFAGRRCIVVYATTEPTEALLFGGYTATLHEGRVTQFGPTGAIYRQPRDLLSAQVFSDPPLNVAQVIKNGPRIELSGGIGFALSGPAAGLPDGPYTWAIRAHHITPLQQAAGRATLDGRVLLAELTGSDSVIHFHLDGATWISQSHGVHPFDVGADAKLFVDVDRSFLFDADGRLVGGSE